MTTTAEPQVDQQRETAVARWRAALGGFLAAMAALAAGELVAATVEGAASPVTSIGTSVINLAPPALRDLAVELLGTADKPALIGGVLIVLALVAAGTGVLAVRRFWLGATGVAVLGLVALGAALADGSATGLAAPLPAVAAIVVGVVVLRVLVITAQTTTPDRGRRGFLRTAAVVAGGAVVAGSAARWLTSRAAAAADFAATILPAADRPRGRLPAGASLDVEGITPFVTDNRVFYRIDTALRVPSIALDDWRLNITGMVDRPFELTFDQLLDYDLVEADVTLTCVSNEVGGDLIGNARWRGVRLVDVLADAGVQPRADQLVGRAVDGFTTGAPVAEVLDGRDALIAIGMNGEPLPRAHGFPARLVVPGLYGYVSATKWLTELELTTFDAFDAYWVPRGWAARAPIKTQSRIDVPRPLATIATGRVAVAGVAWAQHRGVAEVEVQVDDGPWQQARLSEAVGRDTWRQWVYDWDATEGRHDLRVRATDQTGQTQTADRMPPRPDGATGWHSIVVQVAT